MIVLVLLLLRLGSTQLAPSSDSNTTGLTPTVTTTADNGPFTTVAASIPTLVSVTATATTVDIPSSVPSIALAQRSIAIVPTETVASNANVQLPPVSLPSSVPATEGFPQASSQGPAVVQGAVQGIPAVQLQQGQPALQGTEAVPQPVTQVQAAQGRPASLVVQVIPASQAPHVVVQQSSNQQLSASSFAQNPNSGFQQVNKNAVLSSSSSSAPAGGSVASPDNAIINTNNAAADASIVPVDSPAAGPIDTTKTSSSSSESTGGSSNNQNLFIGAGLASAFVVCGFVGGYTYISKKKSKSNSKTRQNPGSPRSATTNLGNQKATGFNFFGGMSAIPSILFSDATLTKFGDFRGSKGNDDGMSVAITLEEQELGHTTNVLHSNGASDGISVAFGTGNTRDTIFSEKSLRDSLSSAPRPFSPAHFPGSHYSNNDPQFGDIRESVYDMGAVVGTTRGNGDFKLGQSSNLRDSLYSMGGDDVYNDVLQNNIHNSNILSHLDSDGDSVKKIAAAASQAASRGTDLRKYDSMAGSLLDMDLEFDRRYSTNTSIFSDV